MDMLIQIRGIPTNWRAPYIRRRPTYGGGGGGSDGGDENSGKHENMYREKHQRKNYTPPQWSERDPTLCMHDMFVKTMPNLKLVFKTYLNMEYQQV